MLPLPATPRYRGPPTELAGLFLAPGEAYPLVDLLDALAEEAREARRARGQAARAA